MKAGVGPPWWSCECNLVMLSGEGSSEGRSFAVEASLPALRLFPSTGCSGVRIVSGSNPVPLRVVFVHGDQFSCRSLSHPVMLSEEGSSKGRSSAVEASLPALRLFPSTGCSGVRIVSGSNPVPLRVVFVHGDQFFCRSLPHPVMLSEEGSSEGRSSAVEASLPALRLFPSTGCSGVRIVLGFQSGTASCSCPPSALSPAEAFPILSC